MTSALKPPTIQEMIMRFGFEDIGHGVFFRTAEVETRYTNEFAKRIQLFQELVYPPRIAIVTTIPETKKITMIGTSICDHIQGHPFIDQLANYRVQKIDEMEAASTPFTVITIDQQEGE